jgi:hypothetical protein
MISARGLGARCACRENFQRFAAKPACDIEFFDPHVLFAPRRGTARARRKRAPPTAFAARPIFLDDQARMMDVIDENAQVFWSCTTTR